MGKTNILNSTTLQTSNPVHLIINEVFHICNDFCNILDENNDESVGNESIDRLDER